MAYLAAVIFCILWGMIIATTGQGPAFIDAISLLAVVAGAACFALAADEGGRLAAFGQGAVLTSWVAVFVGLVLIASGFDPNDMTMLGKQFAVLFLGPLYGYGLLAITRLIGAHSQTD
ncbi:MAG: hypothetical protein VXW11_06765 [Pseudomonadota bacterium]|nr:hypothetical protein [Pseudomonadota bacterium]